MNLYQTLRLAALACKYPRISLGKIMAAGRALFRGHRQFPGVVAVSLFSGCNLTCKMCGQWRQKQTKNVDFLPAEVWGRVFKEIADNHGELYIWGGEPTLHPEFIRVLQLIRQNNLTATVNTNGTMLETFAEEIVASRITSLDISLDGPANVHDSIRGSSGLFARVIAGIRAVESAARKQKVKKPLIKIVVTFSEWNLNDVSILLHELEKNSGVDMSIVQLGWFIPTSAGKRYEERLEKQFQVAATRWRGFENNTADKIAEPVIQAIRQISDNKDLHKPVLFFPRLNLDQIRTYYSEYSETFGNRRCKSLDRELHILADGRVALCLDWPDLVFGSITRQSLKEIWTGEKLSALRKNMMENGLLPVCNRCCAQFR